MGYETLILDVRTTLFGEQHENTAYTEPTLQDDDIDVEDDPEIQAILASAISKNASGAYSQGLDSFDARSPFADATSPRSPEEGEDAEMAKLKVTWLGESFGDGRTKWTFGFMLVGIYIKWLLKLIIVIRMLHSVV
jgi:hypothetical protein